MLLTYLNDLRAMAESSDLANQHVAQLFDVSIWLPALETMKN